MPLRTMYCLNPECGELLQRTEHARYVKCVRCKKYFRKIPGIFSLEIGLEEIPAVNDGELTDFIAKQRKMNLGFGL